MSPSRRHLVLAALAPLALSSLLAAPEAGAIHTAEIGVPGLRKPVVEVRLSGVARGTRRGGVGLLVRNRARARRDLRFRYVSAWGGPRFNVAGVVRTSRRSFRGSLNARRGLLAPARAQDVMSLGIRVKARNKASPEDLGGRLVIVSERPGKGAAVGRPLILRLTGARAEERLVTVSPESVTLPLTRHTAMVGGEWGIERQNQAQAFVDLRGPGATALKRRKPKITVVLRRADGLSERVPVAVKGGPDEVARLRSPGAEAEFDRPGKYEGDLPLGPGRSAPSVHLTVNVHEWWGLAILAVLVGVIWGRIVPPVLKLERVRRKGREAIRDAVRRYVRLRRGHPQPASFDLDALISPVRWDRRGLFAQPRDEATRLLQDIRDGRDEGEVTRAVDDARSLRARVERWARMEQSASRLQECVKAARKAPRREGVGRFAEMPPYADAKEILSALQSDPSDDPSDGGEIERKVGELCIAAERERKVMELALKVWELQADLAGRVREGRHDLERRRYELKRVWTKVTPGAPLERDSEGFVALTTALEIAVDGLEDLEDTYPAHPIPRTGAAVWLRQALRRLRLAAWTALKALFDAALAVGRGLIRGTVRATTTVIARFRGFTTVVEWFSLFLTLSVPSLVYVFTLYNDTWGSPSDFLTAFAAGFGGKVLIDLGVSGYHATTTPGSGKEAPRTQGPPQTGTPQPPPSTTPPANGPPAPEPAGPGADGPGTREETVVA